MFFFYITLYYIAILFFPHQTSWQYSDENSPSGHRMQVG